MPRGLFAPLFCLIFLANPAPVWSEPDNGENAQQLDALQRRIRSIQKALDSIENIKNSVSAELRENERLYGKITRNLKQLNQKIEGQEGKLSKVHKDLKRNTQTLDRYKSTLSRQIRSAHAMGRQDRVKLILNQKDPARLGRLLAYYDQLNQQRIVQVSSFLKFKEKLQRNEQELLAGKKNLQRLRKEQESEMQSLENARQTRKALLAKLDTDYRSRNNELRQLKNDERQLQTLITSVRKAAQDVPFESGKNQSFAKSRGRLPWPVKGKILESFGSPTASGRLNGVLIRAKDGQPVRAVSDGRVVYADWLMRYGLLLIVDHGKGYMTLYAYNQTLYKSVGDKVESGEQIAAVGRSGGRLVPALYFEVRKNGKPANPMKWCRKSRKGFAG